MSGISFTVALNTGKFLAGTRQMEAEAGKSAARVRASYQRMADASAEAWAKAQRSMAQRTAAYAKSDRFVAARDGGGGGGAGALAALGRTAVAMTLVNRAAALGRGVLRAYAEEFPELAVGARGADDALKRMAVNLGRDLDAARAGLEGVIDGLERARQTAVASVSGALRSVFGGDGDVGAAQAANEAAVRRGRAVDAMGARRRELERDLLSGAGDDASRIELARARHREALTANARIAGITPQEREGLDALASAALDREIAQIRDKASQERRAADQRLDALAVEAERRAELAGLSEHERAERQRTLEMERQIAEVHAEQLSSAQARASATERIVRASERARAVELAATREEERRQAMSARAGSIDDAERRVLALEAQAAAAQGDEGLARSIDRSLRQREIMDFIGSLQGLSDSERGALRSRALAALARSEGGPGGRDIFNARLVESGQALSQGTLRQVFGGPGAAREERAAAQRQLDESKRANGLLRRIERNTALGGARFA